jgi:predicted Zn-dependent protease
LQYDKPRGFLMSQANPIPPPIGPVGSQGSVFRYLVLGLVILLGLVVSLELRLVNSNAGKEAAQRIRTSPQVRAEFGDDVHIPFSAGWGDRGHAVVYAFVTGNRAHGYALVNLSAFDGPWVISGLEVHDPGEGHLIDLAKRGLPAQPEQLKGKGSLYFVALGDAASGDVGELASFLDKEFGIPVKILPPMTLPEDAYDARRRQWVAEMLAQAMAAKYPEIAADPDSRIVGVLEDDSYIRSFNWNFTYSYRLDNKYSVIPTVRLDPSFDRFPPSEAIRMERLRKIAMKAVGLLYLGFEESSNPQSVDALEASLADIDRMGSVYLSSDVRNPAAIRDTEGSPCLTFFSANLAGLPLYKPIVPCWQLNSETETTQYQVDLAHGKFQLTRNDLVRGGAVPLRLQRMLFSYRFDDKVRAFGKNSWQSLDDTVWSADPISIQTISVNGTLFQRTTPGGGFSSQAKYRAGPNSGNFSYALLSWEEGGGWRVDTRSGEVWKYLGCGPDTRVQCYYLGHTDLAGDSIVVTRVPGVGHIQQASQRTNNNLPVAAARDHNWTPRYDGDKITEIDDSDGTKALYRYDPQEYLTDVEADGHRLHYEYDNAHHITEAVEDGRTLHIHYDSEGRPDRFDLPNASVYRIRYTGDAVEVDAPNGRYTVTVLPSFFRTVEPQ